MPDKIFLQNLKVSCIIGTLPQERRKKQVLFVDLEFPVSVRQAAKKDDLRDAVNYKDLAESATSFMAQSRFYLIETLAERLAKMLLGTFKLEAISLRIRKPNAIPNAECVGITLTRKR